MHKYFYRLLRQYLSLFILPHNSVVELDPTTPLLAASVPGGRVAFTDPARPVPAGVPADRVIPLSEVKAYHPEYLVLGGVLHYERDIQAVLARTWRLCHPEVVARAGHQAPERDE